MRTFYSLILITLLAGCSTTAPETLSKIETLQIPVVADSAPANKSPAVATLHQQNKVILDQTADELKNDYLRDVRTRDIFDDHSQAHQVYLSLSKLDQIQLMNNYYFKQKNIIGLQKVNDALQPLKDG